MTARTPRRATDEPRRRCDPQRPGRFPLRRAAFAPGQPACGLVPRQSDPSGVLPCASRKNSAQGSTPPTSRAAERVTHPGSQLAGSSRATSPHPPPQNFRNPEAPPFGNPQVSRSLRGRLFPPSTRPGTGSGPIRPYFTLHPPVPLAGDTGGVFSGAHAKSNISSSASAFASRADKAGKSYSPSIKRSSDEWLCTACDT